jgi:hypothetical protein
VERVGWSASGGSRESRNATPPSIARRTCGSRSLPVRRVACGSRGARSAPCSA